MIKSCSCYDVTEHQHGGLKARTGSVKYRGFPNLLKNRFELINFNFVCGKQLSTKSLFIPSKKGRKIRFSGTLNVVFFTASKLRQGGLEASKDSLKSFDVTVVAPSWRVLAKHGCVGQVGKTHAAQTFGLVCLHLAKYVPNKTNCREGIKHHGAPCPSKCMN